MDLVFQRISFPWSKKFHTQPTEKQRTQRDFSHWNFIQCCSTLHCLPFFGKPSADKGKKTEVSWQEIATTTYMQKQTTTESGASIKNQGCHHPWNLRQQRFFLAADKQALVVCCTCAGWWRWESRYLNIPQRCMAYGAVHCTCHMRSFWFQGR